MFNELWIIRFLFFFFYGGWEKKMNMKEKIKRKHTQKENEMKWHENRGGGEG